MKRRRNQLIAMLLSAAMIMTQTFAAVPVFAEELTTAEEYVTEEITEDITEDIVEEDAEEADPEDADVSLIEETAEEVPEEAVEEIFLNSEELELEEDAAILALLEESTASVVKEYPVTVSVVNGEGAATGMYAMDQGVVSEMSDGTIRVRMHQKSQNRNIMALTADKAAAKEMKDEWLYADSDYFYTLNIKSLDDTVTAVFSNTQNVAAGKDFSNPMYISFSTGTQSVTVTAIASGKPSGMYAMDNVVISEQEDGTYLVRMHQAKNNRNVLAITDSTDAATLRETNWYFADNNYVFTIPVETLDVPLTVAFSSIERIKQGYAFSNPIELHFDTESLTAVNAVPVQKSDASSAAIECMDLEIIDTPAMFKVIKAELATIDSKELLYLTLNGSGYEKLVMGTYEEAAATTADPANVNETSWKTAVKNKDGKLTFVLPVEAFENCVLLTALSKSYAEKGEYRWYPRQAVLDLDAGTITVGDYNQAMALDVKCEAKVFADASASLRTIAGPLSNDYVEMLSIGSPLIARGYEGTVEEALAAEQLMDAGEGFLVFDMRRNEKGGVLLFDKLEQPMNIAIQTKDHKWYDVTITASKDKKLVTFDGVKPYNAEITVTAKTSKKIAAGKKVTLTATVNPEVLAKDGITWTSSNKKVATVSKTGVVTMLKGGAGKSVTIKAKIADGTEKAIKLYNMKGIVTKITLSGSSSVKAGKSITLKAKVSTKGGTANKTLKWTSSNEEIAKVSSKGKVTALKKGTVTITAAATDGSGKKVSKKITVK